MSDAPTSPQLPPVDPAAALLREHQLIFEHLRTGVLLVRGATILRCNPRCAAIFGYAAEQLAGSSTRLLYADDASWRDAAARVRAEFLAHGQFAGDLDFVRRDGGRLACHVVGSVVDAADPDAGSVWLLEDITERIAAAARLAEIHREQELIFARARTGILFVRDGLIQRCNPRFEEIFGYPPGSLVGQPTRRLYADEAAWQRTTERVFAEVRATGGFDGDLTHRRRDGSEIVCHVAGQPLHEDNPDTGFVWLFEDITARRNAEARLEKSLREQQLIFDNAMIGICYQRNRVILRCNRRMEEIFGRPPGGLDGCSTRVLFASDADFAAAGERVAEAARGSQTFEAELDYCKADGTAIVAHVVGRTIDASGSDHTWIWTYDDISERRRAEAALRQSHRELEARVAERTAELSQQLHFLRQLIEAIPGPLYYKDRELRYLGANAAFTDFLGIAPERLPGSRAVDLAPPELAAQYLRADQALIASPGRQIYEVQVPHADGSLRDVMLHKATFTNPDGSVGGIVGVMLDISERKQLETRLQQAATVFDSTVEGVLITAPDGSIVAVNRAFTSITGYAEDEVIGRNPRLLRSGRHDPEFYRQLWATVAATGHWQGELWNRRKDGRLYPEWLMINAVRDAAGAVTHYVGVFSDITESKRIQEQLDYQAHHDPLTGLPNRLLLEDRLAAALTRAAQGQLGVAVLFVDLDRFKNINDTLGHQVGDGVLREIAGRFGALVRDSDTVARLGGDEFLIVLDGIGEAAAARVAAEILDDLQRRPVQLEQEFFVGASIGISLFPQHGNDGATLIRNADLAMYRAKERGRNTCEFFTPGLTRFSLERFQLETGLRRAIERDELRVYLQPQFSLHDGRLVGAEALVRWQHPELGLVPPGRFIPLAEESGLIVRLGEWLQLQACRQWAAWTAAGLAPGVLAINVSGIEFRRGHIVASVGAALERTGLAPQLLQVELTESAIMSQAEDSVAPLHELRALGLSLAVDDFGTGYSSLAYLKRLPLTKLKIDQGFVRGLPGDADDGAIVRAVIALGHSLQLTVIAEGVETEAQRDFLAAAGCDEMQGYLRGRPVPFDEFAQAHLAVAASDRNDRC